MLTVKNSTHEVNTAALYYPSQRGTVQRQIEGVVPCNCVQSRSQQSFLLSFILYLNLLSVLKNVL